MDITEQILGAALAALLLGLAVFFGWRQRRTIRTVREDGSLSHADRRYLWQQALRRLCGSALMAAFAGFLIGWLFVGQGLSDLAPAAEQPEAGPMPQHTKDSLRFLTLYWMTALLVLLALLALAVLDLWATARFGMRHRQQLAADRQAALEEEAARLRQRRRAPE